MASLNPSSAAFPPSQQSQSHPDRGYKPNNGISTHLKPHFPPNSNSAATDFASSAQPVESSVLSQSAQHNNGRFNEEWDASQRGSSIIDGHTNMQRSGSVMSQGDTLIPSRGGTLKKKASIKRTGSLKKSSSRRSSRAGSVRSLVLQPGAEVDELQSAFFSPVPTSGNPTEVLANRFQAWRKVLKNLIIYFKEIQQSYETKAKSVLKVANLINNSSAEVGFLQDGGLDDANQILRAYHKNAIAEANRSQKIEEDVILALTGLRSDLNQKIKEIKNLSGDFKNSVEKEMSHTRNAVNELNEGLGESDIDTASTTGKKDPYLLKLAVDRQVEKQIDEENYLHQAYLNLEASGRELEAIVVGEIQKSYNAYAGIIKREAEHSMETYEELKAGPISMPKDHEWDQFVRTDDHFVDPSVPVRQVQNIQYPGRDNELAQEVRAGLLERKSKYLKSYTAGWYVLSPTHLHEFKSADKSGAPVMSLYLPEQKLGSKSAEGASSNKFQLKGRQTGSMHRGHSWVFRCESHETMLAWFEDIRTLTEKSPQERSAFVRQHARSISGASQRPGSISSDGIDEEDDEPYTPVTLAAPVQDGRKRPIPGGRFPSDIAVERLSERGLHAPLSASSGSSNGYGDVQHRSIAAASALPGSGVGQHYADQPESPTHAQMVTQQAQEDGINPYTQQRLSMEQPHQASQDSPATLAAFGLGGAGIGGARVEAYRRHNPEEENAANVAEYNRKLEQQAAREASAIAAPDADAFPAYSEQQASREATELATPDAEQDNKTNAFGSYNYNHPDAQTRDFGSSEFAQPDHDAYITIDPLAAALPPTIANMSGGRSQGDLSSTAIATGTGTDHEHSIEEALKPLTDDLDLQRPSLAAGQNHQSVASISQLHVPGEYPRSNNEAREALGANRLPV